MLTYRGMEFGDPPLVTLLDEQLRLVVLRGVVKVPLKPILGHSIDPVIAHANLCGVVKNTSKLILRRSIDPVIAHASSRRA